jgi:hypothetical protein
LPFDFGDVAFEFGAADDAFVWVGWFLHGFRFPGAFRFRAPYGVRAETRKVSTCPCGFPRGRTAEIR